MNLKKRKEVEGGKGEVFVNMLKLYDEYATI
jgi:hypothetical protein